MGAAGTTEASDASDGRGREPSSWSLRAPVRIIVAAALVAAALLTWGLTGNAGPVYRTAEVGTGTVEATLGAVGTITPVDQAGLSFNASGTVGAVDVSVGQTVTSGQTLASLDIATLNATVTTAQASVASAQATLANAEASETSTSASSTATSSTAASPSAASGQTKQPIGTLQAALVAAQTQADGDSSQATTALTAATTLCEATPTTTPATTTTGSASSGSTGAVGAAIGGGPPGGPGTGVGTGPTAGAGSSGTEVPTTCGQALSLASSAQAKVSAGLKTVAQAESALNSALGSSSSAPSASSGVTTASSTGSSVAGAGSTAGSSTTNGAGSGSGTSKKATPQQVAVDQASIDTAEANLTDARQALSSADLVSTISGTVASVTIATGDSVAAGASTASPQIVVIGTGSSYAVTAAIAVADIGKVTVGQQAVVTPDSTNTVESGRVSSIGVLASTGTSSTTYPVTISLDSSKLGRLSGADANVSIVVKKSVGVTTVPSSAVRTIGTSHVVNVVVSGSIKAVRVTLGTVGDALTQVTSGVAPGDEVSLANLEEPLPSTSTATTRAGLGGLGGSGTFPGGGSFGGGGFGAGRPGG